MPNMAHNNAAPLSASLIRFEDNLLSSGSQLSTGILLMCSKCVSAQKTHLRSLAFIIFCGMPYTFQMQQPFSLHLIEGSSCPPTHNLRF